MMINAYWYFGEVLYVNFGMIKIKLISILPNLVLVKVFVKKTVAKHG